MPVQIGAKTHDFNEPTGLLSDCHRRIEMFLANFVAVAELLDAPPSQETARALQAALRYFHDAAPKHTADEEESLFPRLRDIQDPELTSALFDLERLEEQHQLAAQLHAEVERVGSRYLNEGTLPDSEKNAFRSAVKQLQALYQEHISIEDSTVFPLAFRLLSNRDKAQIGREMAGRRQALIIESDTEKATVKRASD